MAKPKRESRLRSRLSEVTNELLEEMKTLQGLVAGGADPKEMRRHQQEVATLSEEQRRLTDQIAALAAPKPQRKSRVQTRPAREIILDALDDLGGPVQANLCSAYIFARFGAEIETRKFSSIRRDDTNRLEKKPDAYYSRSAWIVPAIHAQWLTEMPREMTSSAWPLEMRIIGARTFRVMHLKTVCTLANRWLETRDLGDEERHARFDSLLRSYGDTFLGPELYQDGIDAEKVCARASAELREIEPVDSEERQAAAGKLKDSPLGIQLFGRKLEVVEGGLSTGRRA